MMLFTLSATAIQPSYMYIPPLTARTCPVIYDASSEARKHTAAATSSGVPSRPAESAPPSPVRVSVIARVMSVSISPGRHHVHRDVARRHLARQRLAEPDEPRLRRRVVRLPGVAHLPDHRADAMMRPPRCLIIGFSTACVQRERRGQVRGDHGVPVVALHPQHQLVARDAGVVHQDVDAAVPLDTPATSASTRRGVGHVEPRLAPPARRTISSHHRARVVAARRRHDVRARARQHQRDRAPDAARRAGHDRDLARQSSMMSRCSWRWKQRLRRAAQGRPGVSTLNTVASRSIFLTRPSAPCPGPLQHTCVTPSAARRRITSSQRTGADTCDQRLDGAAPRRASARHPRWPRPARAGRARRARAAPAPAAPRPASSARSGTARSPSAE
jgi:hypothetical protein